MTVAFFKDGDSASCNRADTSKALILTTDTVPASRTCFNIADIFSQSNTTGFQHGYDSISILNSTYFPNGIYWLIKNLENYDPNANYTHVWFEQNDFLGNVREGTDGERALYISTYEGCIDKVGDDYPFIKASCRTKAGGQCREVSKPIKSFAFAPTENFEGNQENREQCEAWKVWGAAASLKPGIGELFSIALGVVVTLIL